MHKKNNKITYILSGIYLAAAAAAIFTAMYQYHSFFFYQNSRLFISFLVFIFSAAAAALPLPPVILLPLLGAAGIVPAFFDKEAVLLLFPFLLAVLLMNFASAKKTKKIFFILTLCVSAAVFLISAIRISRLPMTFGGEKNTVMFLTRSAAGVFTALSVLLTIFSLKTEKRHRTKKTPESYRSAAYLVFAINSLLIFLESLFIHDHSLVQLCFIAGGITLLIFLLLKEPVLCILPEKLSAYFNKTENN